MPAAAAAAGSTPLHFAVDVDRPESAQILLTLAFRFGHSFDWDLDL
jgi:hypothetical protein